VLTRCHACYTRTGAQREGGILTWGFSVYQSASGFSAVWVRVVSHARGCSSVIQEAARPLCCGAGHGRGRKP